MASLNKVTLIGNLGRDPEIRYTPSGDPVASFSIATTETWKGRDGEKQERTEWHRVDVFGKLAEIVRDFLGKGSQVYVEGSLTTDSWTDKEGNKRQTTKVKLSGPRAVLVMLGGKRKERDGSETGEYAAPQRTAAPPDDFQVSDDDVPF